MGNFCYGEQNNEIQEQNHQNVADIQIDMETSQNLNQKQQLKIQVNNTIMTFPPIKLKERRCIYSSNFSLENFHKDLIDVFSEFFNPKDQSKINDNNQLKWLFDTSESRMVSDCISEFTLTQIQLQMAIKKNLSGIKNFSFLNQGEEIIGQAICSNIVSAMIPLFLNTSQLIKNPDLLRLFRSIQIVYLVCDTIKQILDQYLQQDSYKNNIKLYNLFYQSYSNLILNLNQENELFYNDLHHFLDFNKINHFSLLGYYLRFWCQIVLTKDDQQKNNIRNLLLDSFRNVNTNGLEFEIYTYILGAIDLCSNEFTSNWIGHQTNFQIDRLVDMSHNELNHIIFIDLESYIEKINQKLSYCRTFYPSWIYEIKYLLFSLDLKIKNLMGVIKQVYKFTKDDQQSNIYQIRNSYSEMPTGYGLFNQIEKQEDQDQQMKTMAFLLLVDDKVNPKSTQLDSQPFFSLQEKQKIKKEHFSQLKIEESQENLDKAKMIDKYYFKHLKIIRLEYKKLLSVISRRNTIIEARNQKIYSKYPNDEIKNYNFFKTQSLQKEQLNNLTNLIKQTDKQNANQMYQSGKQFFSKQIKKVLQLKIIT